MAVTARRNTVKRPSKACQTQNTAANVVIVERFGLLLENLLLLNTYAGRLCQ